MARSKTSTQNHFAGDTVETADKTESWTLLSPLGEGCFAEVWLARQDKAEDPAHVGRMVAAKILVATDADRKASDLARLEREAMVHERLLRNGGSEFVAKVHGTALDADGRVTLLMEYADGGTLGQYAESARDVPAQRLAWIGQQVARGMADAGVVHRDIKPDNIMIDGHGADLPEFVVGDYREHGARCLIADFGLVARAGLIGAPRLTAKDQCMGSPIYMAPEAYVSPDVDCRADIFALGVALLVVANNGDYPREYHGKDKVPDIMMAAADGLACREIVDVKLRAVVRKMVAPRPVDRLSNWREVEAALAAISGATIRGRP